MNWKGKLAAEKAVNTLRYRRLEKSNLVLVLALHDEIQEAEKSLDYDFSREGYIAQNIDKTNWNSFCRWGDRNKATNGLILHWIKKDGAPLDEQAMFMSENYGTEIEPWELANFMADYPHISSFGPLAKIEGLKKAFKEVAGFKYDFRWINKHLSDAGKEPVLDMPF